MENTHQPRVVVAVDHSLAGFAALRVAVAMARSRRVPLRAVRATAGIGAADEEYIRWAFDEAVGGIPPDLEVHLDVSFGSASWMLSRLAPDPRDLIVVANDGRGMIRATLSGSLPRAVFKHARCQVLVVPAPEMHNATRRSARKLHAHRADVWDRFDAESPQQPRGRPYQGA